MTSGRRRFVLALEDRQIITCVVNYFSSIADSFVRAQTHPILRLCLSLMVKIPGHLATGCAFLILGINEDELIWITPELMLPKRAILRELA